VVYDVDSGRKPILLDADLTYQAGSTVTAGQSHWHRRPVSGPPDAVDVEALRRREMKRDSDCSVGPFSGRHARLRLDPRGARDLPLSRRAELAADALVSGRVVILINNILNKRDITAAAVSSLVDDGIRLAERLQQGDFYLEESRTHFIARPESVDIVSRIRARGTSKITARAAQAVSILTRIKELDAEGRPTELTEADAKLAQSSRDFFRDVQTSITDQLAAAVTPSERVDLE
jgi:hypothetical protein